MNMLAIDTAANLCAACVYDAERGVELGRSVLDIGTGHAEKLMDVIAEALRAADATYADLGAVAVSIGPGSFTGVRIGVSAARGFAMALKIPAIGVSTLEAMAEEARARFPGRETLAVLDARRDEIYALFHGENGALRAGPMLTSVAEMAGIARDARPVLCGSAARMVAAAAGPEIDFDIGLESATADIATYARLAAMRGPGEKRPKPLYLRGAGAKPQGGFALPRRAN